MDLAGSERVKKTGIEGTVLREARYINLSLHFLEQERKDTHTSAHLLVTRPLHPPSPLTPPLSSGR